MITIFSPFCYLVYVHWHENILLYVGKGHGLTRPFERAHKMFQHRDEITHTDIHQCCTEQEALTLEKELKSILGKPKYDEEEKSGRGKLHLKRQVPEWAKSDERIQKIISYAPSDRWAKIIDLYFIRLMTDKQVGDELGLRRNRIRHICTTIDRVARGLTVNGLPRGLRPRGRPRKS